jgi:Family of unknown function (DUF6467)
VGALALMEATLKYHPGMFEVLTLARNPGRGQCMVGSLTGAVSSQRVTEECKGTLSVVGHHALECKGIRVLNCETDRSSRCESRS